MVYNIQSRGGVSIQKGKQPLNKTQRQQLNYKQFRTLLTINTQRRDMPYGSLEALVYARKINNYVSKFSKRPDIWVHSFPDKSKVVPSKIKNISFNYVIEQSPHPDNRVHLHALVDIQHYYNKVRIDLNAWRTLFYSITGTNPYINVKYISPDYGLTNALLYMAKGGKNEPEDKVEFDDGTYIEQVE